jgi:hypothetical protein
LLPDGLLICEAALTRPQAAATVLADLLANIAGDAYATQPFPMHAYWRRPHDGID